MKTTYLASKNQEIKFVIFDRFNSIICLFLDYFILLVFAQNLFCERHCAKQLHMVQMNIYA